MHGIITGREVATHFGLIWREFGPRCVLRCLWACLGRKRTTFLDIVFAPGRAPQCNNR